MGSLTLVSNTILAPLLLGESITRRDLFATGAIVCGSAVAVVFADKGSAILTVPQLFACFATLRFALYAAVVAAAVVALMLAELRLSVIQFSDVRRYHG